MSYFERLAQRAIGVPVAGAAMPRARSWFDPEGIAELETVTELPRAIDRAPAPHAPAPVAAAGSHVIETREVGAAPTAFAAATTVPLAPAVATSVVPPAVHAAITVARADHAEPDAPTRAEAPSILTAAAAPIESRTIERRTEVETRTSASRTVEIRSAAPAATPPAAEPSWSETARSPLANAAPPQQRDSIRVHIGRVDVRAVFPAPPSAPKRAPERIAPSLTLDKFLARGKGGDR